MTAKRDTHRDRGMVLPLVLVIAVVMAVVVLALATYATATLRQGQVVEASADRLASANAGMDNALEDIQRGTSDCTTTALADGTYTYQLKDAINGIHPVISCTRVSGTINAVDSYAVILTGEGVAAGDPLLTVENGNNKGDIKTFTGKVYMARTPIADVTLDLSAKLNIESGDLLYTGACAGPNHDLDDPALDLVNSASQYVKVVSTGYYTRCTQRLWTELFNGRKPIEPNVDALTARTSTLPPALVDPHGNGVCYVWEPGHYTGPMPFLPANTYHYFKSGDYYFENMGTWSLEKTWVLFGWPGGTGPSIGDNKDIADDANATAGNNPCKHFWSTDQEGDPNRDGASVYMGGNSAFEVLGTASLEISAKKQDSGRYNLALQALEDRGVPSTLGANDWLVRTATGNKKQLAIEGFVWAPKTGLEFDLISNASVAALSGGAVLSHISAGAAANTNNFVVTAGTGTGTAALLVTSTAVNSGTTTARTKITYRADRQFEVLSRRIVNLTPESP